MAEEEIRYETIKRALELRPKRVKDGFLVSPPWHGVFRQALYLLGLPFEQRGELLFVPQRSMWELMLAGMGTAHQTVPIEVDALLKLIFKRLGQKPVEVRFRGPFPGWVKRFGEAGRRMLGVSLEWKEGKPVLHFWGEINPKEPPASIIHEVVEGLANIRLRPLLWKLLLRKIPQLGEHVKKYGFPRNLSYLYSYGMMGPVERKAVMELFGKEGLRGAKSFEKIAAPAGVAKHGAAEFLKCEIASIPPEPITAYQLMKASLDIENYPEFVELARRRGFPIILREQKALFVPRVTLATGLLFGARWADVLEAERQLKEVLEGRRQRLILRKR